MNLRVCIVATAAAALSACAGGTTGVGSAPAFDPAFCTQRDFNIYFEEGSQHLTPEARRLIELEARNIRGCEISGVRIIGLSDQDEGSDATTRELSIERASTLARYLSERTSWPESRFEILAAGERGAVTSEGLDVPVRNRARIIVSAAPPAN